MPSPTGEWVPSARRAANGELMQRQTKMAAGLAAKIQQNIVELGWPVGKLLGGEPELLERYGVSRAVFREAIRLLEHAQVVEMRRGRNGGLFVTQPDPESLADSVALFLRYRGVDVRQLFDVRQALELAAVRLAAVRSTEEEAKQLREEAAGRSNADGLSLAAESARFHDHIAQMSGNPAIHLFIQILTLLTESVVDHSPAELMVEGVHRAHVAIAEAIEAADPDAAHRRMLRHFEAITQVGFVASSSPESQEP